MKLIRLLSIILAIALIFLSVYPILVQHTLTNDSIATAIIIVLIAIAYIISVFKPGWTKAVFFFEGIVFGVFGYILLEVPYNFIFGLIGLIIVIIAILAYLMKLPPSLLKLFYK